MKITSTSPASTRFLLGVAVLLVSCFMMQASAKRGCSAFGHSCFGAHGKRSDSSDRVEDTIPEDVGVMQDNQDYEMPREDEEILMADVGQIYQDRPMPRFWPLQRYGDYLNSSQSRRN